MGQLNIDIYLKHLKASRSLDGMFFMTSRLSKLIVKKHVKSYTGGSEIMKQSSSDN